MPQPTILQINAVREGSNTIENNSNVSITGGNIRVIGSNFTPEMTTVIVRTDTGDARILPTANVTISGTSEQSQAIVNIPPLPSAFYSLVITDADGSTAWKHAGIFTTIFPTWNTVELPQQRSGVPMDIRLSANNSSSFELASGSTLPSGLTLSSTGALTGSINLPQGVESDTFVFQINVKGPNDSIASRSFSLTVVSGIWMERLSLPEGKVFHQIIRAISGAGTNSPVVVAVGGHPGLSTKNPVLEVSYDNGLTWRTNTTGITAANGGNMYCIAQHNNCVIIGCDNSTLIVNNNTGLTGWNRIILSPTSTRRILTVNYHPRTIVNRTTHHTIACGDGGQVWYTNTTTPSSFSTWRNIGLVNNAPLPNKSITVSGTLDTNTGVIHLIVLANDSGSLVYYSPNLADSRGYFNITSGPNNIFSQGWPVDEEITTISSRRLTSIVRPVAFIGGSKGTYATTTDGFTWNIRSSLRASLGEIASSSVNKQNNFMVVGNGKVATSSDLQNWTVTPYRPLNNPLGVSKSVNWGPPPPTTMPDAVLARYFAADNNKIYSNI